MPNSVNPGRGSGKGREMTGKACMAFQITEEDVENVLSAYGLRVVDSKGKSFEALAAELVGEIDCARVEEAALNSGVTLEEQTQGAFEEIKDILVEMGVLEF